VPFQRNFRKSEILKFQKVVKKEGVFGTKLKEQLLMDFDEFFFK